jgi:hypothetical protein
MLSPKVLMESGCPVYKIIHNPGEYIVTLPGI